MSLLISKSACRRLGLLYETGRFAAKLLPISYYKLISYNYIVLLNRLQIQQQEEAPTTTAGEYYTDAENGFRFQLPAGWVAEEPSEEFSDDVLNLVGEIKHARVTICPEQSAQPVIGGGSDCLQDATVGSGLFTMGVGQYDFDLDAAAAFRDVIAGGGSITTDDLLAFELQQARAPESLIGTAFENTDIRVINETDRTTNLVDADTGEVISSDAVQVKEVQYTYRSYVSEANNLPVPDEIRTRLFAVYNNPEDADDVRAFAIFVGIPSEGETVQDSPPGETLQRPPVRQVFDSFELVAPATSIEATTPPTPTMPTPSPPPEQQEQQPLPSPPQQTPELVL